MNPLISASNLIFFKSEQYIYNQHHTVDNRNCPRPHFCAGFLRRGHAVFNDCAGGADIFLSPGELILVPVSSRYVSQWHGDPEVDYISLHFLFDEPGIFSRQHRFALQKISPESPSELQQDFEYILCHSGTADEATQLQVLSRLYHILSVIRPALIQRPEDPTDIRIRNAISFIEQHYTENLSIEQLAVVSNMSVSRFFPGFKKATGVTPIDYLHHFRINRAIILLMNDDLSIEQISGMTGFESSAYFRRVFRKITGKSPREYRHTITEL